MLLNQNTVFVVLLQTSSLSQNAFVGPSIELHMQYEQLERSDSID
jgi:hypothetical protein